ncbi:MAG: hypothetical protein PSV46_04185 [Reyranella sp.]|nr:hypothetical protein [Reyranella sp.]
MLLLLPFTVAMPALAQTNPVTAINITLPANPDANTANWGTDTSLLTIAATAKGTAGRVDPAVAESRILVIIKKGGTKICGAHTGASAPAANFNAPTKEWSSRNAVALLGQDCILPPGDYELSVQFFSAKGVALSAPGTKAFSVKKR